MIKNYVELKSYFSGYDYVLVAFSGGVDSALVLKGAIDSLGTGRVLAVTANSPSLSDRARNEAIQLARELRCNHRLVTTEEWRKAQYRANGPDRCYHCKTELYQIMRLVERELPPSIIQGAEDGRTTVLIANGANRDDVGDHRPGMQAATENKIASPLLELGMTKQDVRSLAKAIGLNVWSKPAAPCLASRVPYHTEVTPHKLSQIEKAEDCLYALGFRDFRVRHHDVIARVELQISDMHRAIESGIRERIVRELRQIGYQFIALDLAGFKSGNLNHSIVDEVSHYSSSK